ncbi:hypothetical protein [uncultured Proteiniphilum sp.]|uniref:hypothetical protein n=1 Tax=uncultured Proteiniphilum sp. TaxID=497637 RepID=UPI00260B4C38|nr:hypothetical protein [uncultured Proteiniphilum sp.]
MSMNSFFYIYNNEALVSLVITRLLREVTDIDLARAAVIVSVLLNDLSIDTLNSANYKTMKQFLKGTTGNLLKYNGYYYAMLPILINSLKIIVDLGFASFNKEKFYLNRDIPYPNPNSLGSRYSEICRAIPLFMSLANKYPTEKLYELFRIRL